jgi:hypothetical protein
VKNVVAYNQNNIWNKKENSSNLEQVFISKKKMLQVRKERMDAKKDFEARRLMVRNEIARRTRFCKLVAKRNQKFHFQALSQIN